MFFAEMRDEPGGRYGQLQPLRVVVVDVVVVLATVNSIFESLLITLFTK